MTLTVVLTREPPRNDDTRHALKEFCRVLEVPLTLTNYFDDTVVATSLAALPFAHQFATVIVTSARAARYLALALGVAGSDAAVVTIGPATTAAVRDALESASSVPVVQAPAATADALGSSLTRGPVLALGAASPRPELRDVVVARGLVFSAVACYETVPVALTGFTSEELRVADVLVVAAPSAWRVARNEIRRGTTVVAIGATTAAEVLRDHELVTTAEDRDLVATVRNVLERLGQIDRRT